MEIKTPKKLIEVALPLDAINKASAYEKLPGIGPHPRGLHQWWSRKPLAAARAVIFAQMVNDPGYERHLGRGVNKEKAELERERLFRLIEKLVQWKNTNNEEVLQEAREEIWKSWRETCDLNKNHPQAAELFNPEKLPAFHDPFAGGGALPLEAQRLGLEAYASDLNPVAVAINKAMIDIPYKFSNQPPVGPIPCGGYQPQLVEDWLGANGLAEDVRRYGAWISEEAEIRIGNLYPKIEVTSEMASERPDLKPLVGEKLTVISWLWARTVKSPNPAYAHKHVPLASTFVLSNKKGRETYVEPVINGDDYQFKVRLGNPAKHLINGTKISQGSFKCILSDTPIMYKYIDEEANSGRMGVRLMGIVALGRRNRVYLSPTIEHECIALQIQPNWKPNTPCRGTFASNAQGRRYGFHVFGDYFTNRQLLTLTTLSDLVTEAIDKCFQDSIAAGLPDDGLKLTEGGNGAKAYSEAVGIYLSFLVDRTADFNNTGTGWRPGNEKIMNLFSQQGIPMVWDYGEANTLAEVVGGFPTHVMYQSKCIELLNATSRGEAKQEDAASSKLSHRKVVSTDPPYYDNISWADLSDFFYVWLRRSLKPIFPDLFATMAVPKKEELIATPYRHENKSQAEAFFLDGMKDVLSNICNQANTAFPVTIYYAFKQSETKGHEGTSNTGWETFLEAVVQSGFSITGTWPLRSEQSTRRVGLGNNSLASSIVLVCRKRSSDAPSVSRRDFIRELNAVLPVALDEMTRGGVNSPVAPVDLSQAIIGPGMAIFSRYSAVLEADGSQMTVRSALQLINRFLTEDDFDQDTQFCLLWFENFGWSEGKYGEAEVLSKSKGTSVNGLQASGVVESGVGKFRLLRWSELPKDWSPKKDMRTPIWESLHQLIRALNQESENAAGGLLAKMPSLAEPIRALAYRMYTLCERKGWAEEARSYNELIGAWSGVEAASFEVGHVGEQFKFDM